MKGFLTLKSSSLTNFIGFIHVTICCSLISKICYIYFFHFCLCYKHFMFLLYVFQICKIILKFTKKSYIFTLRMFLKFDSKIRKFVKFCWFCLWKLAITCNTGISEKNFNKFQTLTNKKCHRDKFHKICKILLLLLLRLQP